MTKSLAIYAVLVGLPFAGLVAILHAGGSLHAPPAIGGEWRVDGGGVARTLTLVQSGEHVEAALGGRTLRGWFVGDSLTADARASRTSSPGRCSDAAAARLRVRVDTAARPERMEGTLTPAAARCAPVPFAAVRAAGAKERR